MRISPMDLEQVNETFTSQSLINDKQIIMAMIKAGELEAYKIGECAFISQFVHTENGKVLSVYGAEGANYVKACLVLIRTAINNNCTSLDYCTRRKGIVSWGLKYGAEILSVKDGTTYLKMRFKNV